MKEENRKDVRREVLKLTYSGLSRVFKSMNIIKQEKKLERLQLLQNSLMTYTMCIASL